MTAIFIRSEFRPDLREAMSLAASGEPWMAPFGLSGCGEKTDKSDKTKEVGKDDKSNRAPVKDRAFLARDGSLSPSSHVGSPYTTIFA